MKGDVTAPMRSSAANTIVIPIPILTLNQSQRPSELAQQQPPLTIDKPSADSCSCCSLNLHLSRRRRRLSLFTLVTLVLAHSIHVVQSDGSNNVDEMNDEASLKAVVKASDDFSFRFYNEIAKGSPNKNLILSPLSVQTVLAMLLQGAEGGTKSELVTGLKLAPNDDHTIQNGFRQLLDQLKSDNLTIDIANRIYVDKKFELKENFKNVLVKYFKSSTGIVNFQQQPEPARQEINKWVESKTNQRIKDLLPQGVISSDTRSVLVNAIYFKGLWKTQFKKENTAPGDFYVSSNENVTVEYMKLNNHKFNYAEIESLDAKVLELPYSDDNYSMLIILPNTVDGLSKLETQLSKSSLEEIRSQLDNTEVNVLLPKFKIESTFTLNEPLIKLGMQSMFSDGSANFSGISDERLVVSQVIQKAFVEVNEEGTEAAAATGVLVRKRRCCFPEPESFLAERPFTLSILHQQSRLPIFRAHVVHPPPPSPSPPPSIHYGDEDQPIKHEEF